MKRTVIFWGAIGLLLAAVFLWSGCAPRMSAREDGRVEIVYWEKWTAFEGETIRKLVDEYNQTQGKADNVFVRLQTVSQIDRKLLVAIAGGNPPDLAGTYDTVLPGYAAAGAILPLDGRLGDSGTDTNDFIAVHWRQGTAYGQTWGVPIAAASVALHYNKTLFRRAGLDPDQPPRTLAELDAMAERLTKRDAITGDYTQMGFLHHEPGWFHRYWPFYFGGRLWDGEDGMELNSPEAVQAWQWVRSYSEKYDRDRMMRFIGGRQNRLFNSPQNPFLSGRVAMELQGTWMYNFIDKYAPGMQWGVAPFPTPDGMPTANPGFTTDLLVIPKGASHPAEAWKFVEWMLQPAQCEAMALGHRKYPVRKQASDAFWARHPHPYIREFFSYALQTNAVPAMHDLPIGTLLIREIDAVMDDLRGLKITSAQAGDILQKRLQKELEVRMRSVERRMARQGQ